MIVVSDTSAITSLLQVSHEHLLRELYREVLIPFAVRDELLRPHSILPEFIQARDVENGLEVRRFLAELDGGEAEAIVLAKECKAELLLIDELAGRRVAAREGVPFIGLMGVLVQAKHQGYIRSVRDLCADLERVAAFRLSEKIKAITFRNAGES